MKNTLIYVKAGILAVVVMVMVTACEAPVTLTSWKDPQNTTQVSKLVVMPLFEKLEYMKPFENSVVNYFNSRGLKSIGSLSFLNPNNKYAINDIKHKCDSLGADAILLFDYKGTDKSQSYVPPTTYYTGYYGGYGGYWGAGYWGGGYYGGTVTTGGYWETTSVVYVTAKLFVKGSKEPLWTGEISVTYPTHVDQAAYTIAQYILGDWQKSNILKNTKGK